MKANLFINYYIDKNTKRNNELVTCLIKNLENKAIDRLIIVLSSKDKDSLKSVLKEKSKVFIIIYEGRPSYNFFFKLTNQFPDDINIIANTDIIISEPTAQRLKEWHWRNYCLALSRYDYIDDKLVDNQAIHYNKRDSQDVWIVKGRFKNIPLATFPLGKKGCDNRIAYLLSRFYHVINPSFSLRTYHYHLSDIRNYAPHGTSIDLVPPPYKLVTPMKLPL